METVLAGRTAARDQRRLNAMLKKESQKNWMKGHVVSNLPGRIRLEAEGLSNLFE